MCQRWIQRRRTGCASPCLIIFNGVFLKTRINFIVINMQCYNVLNSLRSLQKHRICVKGHQNNLQTSKIIPRRDSAPQFLNSWIRQCVWHAIEPTVLNGYVWISSHSPAMVMHGITDVIHYLDKRKFERTKKVHLSL